MDRRFVTAPRWMLFSTFALLSVGASAATSETLASAAPPAAPAASPAEAFTTPTLSKLLPTTSTAPAEPPGFFNEIPPELEPAVRLTAEENYSSAAALLLDELNRNPRGRELARVHLWLGLTYGSQAVDFPDAGWIVGTSATAHLRQAFDLAPDAYEASDAARMLAEMVSHGWAGQDPAAAIQAAESKAAESRKASDYYFAGVVARRQSQLAWAYSDTTERDKQVLALFTKAVELDPLRYEYWAAFLRAMMPTGLHAVAVVESPRMYAYFKPQRVPTLYDPGPAAGMLSVGAGFDMASEQKFLHDLAAERPDDPYPRFQLGLTAIETSPQLAIERFEDLLQRIDKGAVKLKPREQGLKVSALYKLAFLSLEFKTPGEALDCYRKVRAISPDYASVNNNIAAVLGRIADMSTSGPATNPRKIRLLQEALEHVNRQQNYRGRTAKETIALRERIEGLLRELKAAQAATTQTAALGRETPRADPAKPAAASAP